MGMTWELFLIIIFYQKWNLKAVPVENTLLAFLFNMKLSKTLKGKDSDLQDMCSFILHDRSDTQFKLCSMQGMFFILTAFQSSHTATFFMFKKSCSF